MVYLGADFEESWGLVLAEAMLERRGVLARLERTRALEGSTRRRRVGRRERSEEDVVNFMAWEMRVGKIK